MMTDASFEFRPYFSMNLLIILLTKVLKKYYPFLHMMYFKLEARSPRVEPPKLIERKVEAPKTSFYFCSSLVKKDLVCQFWCFASNNPFSRHFSYDFSLLLNLIMHLKFSNWICSPLTTSHQMPNSTNWPLWWRLFTKPYWK